VYIMVLYLLYIDVKSKASEVKQWFLLYLLVFLTPKISGLFWQILGLKHVETCTY
jgi:hypothetical protein